MHMTTHATIRVRRADGTEADLPAYTFAWSLDGHDTSLGESYREQEKDVVLRTTGAIEPVTIELPIERAARLERELEKLRATVAGVLDATAARYHTDIFPVDGTSLDAKSARFARLLIESIRSDIEEALSGGAAGDLIGKEER
jgi:hypothetical protein